MSWGSRAIAVLSFLGFTWAGAFGWDTLPELPGKTAYKTPYRSYDEGCLDPRNEHPYLARRTFCAAVKCDTADTKALEENQMMPLNGRHGTKDPTDTLVVTSLTQGLRCGGSIEQVILPAPYMFAGGPDFSWTVYDWINRNRLCPPLPMGAEQPELCHEFRGWLGAALNASHFGTRAKTLYMHYHSLAVSRAEEANRLFDDLLSGIPAGGRRKALEAYVKEAEIEALIFEGFGQHFLQDRWSTGHMWERWGPAEYADIIQHKLPTLFEAGMASGILHGSRSAVKCDHYASTALSLCEPSIVGGPCTEDRPQMCGQLQPARSPWDAAKWRDDPSVVGKPEFGVGDLYLRQILASDKEGPGWIGGTFKEQKRRMLKCGAAGWAAVIHRFHPNGSPKKYGVLRLEVRPDSDAFEHPDRVLSEGTCWNAWATNASMQKAWRTIVWSLPQAGALVGDFVLRVQTSKIAGPPQGELASRLALARVGFMADMAAKLCPDNTDLARGKYPPSCVTHSGITDWMKYILSADGAASTAVWLVDTLIDTPAGIIVDGGGYVVGQVKSLLSRAFGGTPSMTNVQDISLALSCNFMDEFAFGCVRPDNAYHADDYVLKYADQIETPKLSTNKSCETRNDNFAGRDVASIFGFFSRAHVRDWCEPRVVGELRDGPGLSPADSKRRAEIDSEGCSDCNGYPPREVCAYLAERLYLGTQRSYEGERNEPLKDPGRTVPQWDVSGICSHLDSKLTERKEEPIYLPAGYVARPDRPVVLKTRLRNELSEFYERLPIEFSTERVHESIWNWCGRVPILLSANHDDIVAQCPSGCDATIRGRDLGSGIAELTIEEEGPDGREVQRLPVRPSRVPGQDDQFSLKLAPGVLVTGRTYRLTFTRDDRESSVGLFRVAVGVQTATTLTQIPSASRDSKPTITPIPVTTGTITNSPTTGADVDCIYFDSGCYNLSDRSLERSSRRTVDCIPFSPDATAEGVKPKLIAQQLASMRKDVGLRIEGYCDNVGNPEMNAYLGCLRAEKVRSALREEFDKLGVTPTRLCTLSHGKEKARLGGLWEDRRVSVTMDDNCEDECLQLWNKVQTPRLPLCRHRR